MAKRVPPEDTPYRPVDDSLVRSVLDPPPAPRSATSLGPLPASELATVEGRPHSPAPERLSREKRLLMTPSEEREFETLVSEMAEALGTPLKSSHVLRASAILLRHAHGELVQRCRSAGPMRRPPNGDLGALARFEGEIAKVIDQAIRNVRSLT